MSVVKTDYTKGLSLIEKCCYHLLYGIIYLHSLLPFCILYALSNLFYFIVYYFIAYRKKVVRKNLAGSFPEKSAEELLRIEKAFYHWLCDYILETFKLATMSHEEVGRRMKVNNIEVVNNLCKNGKSVALYLGHYCNWEWVTSIGLYIPKDVIGGQVYHVLENKVVDRVFLRLRSKMNTECISMENILKRMVAEKRNGNSMVIGFISDQVPFWNNIHYWTDFFHRDTPVLTGTERLAKKYDYACVYVDLKRVKRGYYEMDFRLITDTPKDYADWDITELYFRELEKTICRQPEFWLWTHNRWKRTREQYNSMKISAREKL